jgi:hypothetical protein
VPHPTSAPNFPPKIPQNMPHPKSTPNLPRMKENKNKIKNYIYIDK